MTCVLGLVLSILATLLPTLIAIVVLWWLDRYEKEPLWLLSIIVLWGAVPTIILSLIAQLILDIPLSVLLGPSIFYAATNLSIVAPLTEETFKTAIILAIFLFYRSEFDGVMDGILYGALVGFGFSMVEDVFYFMGSLLEGGWGDWGITVALRVGLYNLNHAMFTAFAGLGFGLARNSRALWQKLLYPVCGWLAAMALHGIHNGGAVLAETTGGLSCVLGSVVDWLGALSMLILILVATWREKRWFDQLKPEIAAGVITQDEYQIASQYKTRLVRGWQILTRHGIDAWLKWNRYVQSIVDLAFKKHQKEAAGEGAKTEQRIAELRQQIAQDRAALPNRGA